MTEIVKDKDYLSKPCELVKFGEALQIISFLREEIKNIDNALGLAANQIGINKQVFIIKRNDYWVGYSNPSIISKQDPFINLQEGCLSFPDIYINTIRYKKIVVIDGSEEKLELAGLEAVAFQHEQDHINGITFFERKIPDKYEKCFCGSGFKFKFCCMSKLK